MHELSIVLSILNSAEKTAREHHAKHVEKIELEIGKLAGVQMEALDFAWQHTMKGTILEHAERIIHEIKGEAKCLGCETVFELKQVYDPCPLCDNYFSRLLGGKELKIKSLVIN